MTTTTNRLRRIGPSQTMTGEPKMKTAVNTNPIPNGDDGPISGRDRRNLAVRPFIARLVVAALCAASLLGASLAIGVTTPAFAAGVNLGITISGPSRVENGVPALYTVVVTNTGASTAVDAGINLPAPSGFTVTWTCAFSAGGTCTPGPAPASGLGDIHMTVPSGGNVTYTMMMTPPSSQPSLFLPMLGIVGTNPPDLDADQSNNMAAKFIEWHTSDVSITISNATNVVQPGHAKVYTIVAKNTGPQNLVGGTVDAVPDGGATSSWTCTGSVPAATCAASGSGYVDDTVNIPSGATVTYTMTVNVPPDVIAPFVVGATVTPPVGFVEDAITGTANNHANDSDQFPAGPTEADGRVTVSNGLDGVWDGAPLTYTIVMANDGPAAVDSAFATATFPTDTTWTCVASPGAACTGSVAPSTTLNDTIVLPVGGTVTYTATHTAVAPALTWDVTAQLGEDSTALGGDPDNDEATDSDGMQSTSELAITNTDGGTTSVPGSPVHYTIIVTNNGPDNDFGSRIDDVLPVGLIGATWTCAPVGVAFCTSTGSGDIHDTAITVPGASVVYTVNATVAPGASGSLVNSATITPRQNRAPGYPVAGGVHDPNLANNTATDTDTIIEPNLVATMTAPGEVPTNSNLAYTVTLANTGSAAAAAASITMPTPTGTTFVSAVQNTGPSATLTTPTAGGTGLVAATTASLPAGATQTFTLTVRLGASIAPSTVVMGTTTAATTTFESVMTNNVATTSTTVNGRSDVSLRVALESAITAGSNATYLLSVANAGPDAATSRITVTDVLPSGLSFVSASGPGWTCVNAAGTVTCATDDDLAAGATSTITLVVAVAPGASGTITNTATVDNHEVDADSVDRSGSAGGTVLPGARLFTGLDPVRVFDTRPDQPQGAVAVTQHKYGGANVLKVKIAGTSGVPVGGVGAVSLNVTAVDPAGPGYVTVFPCGAQPTASSLNYVIGQTVPNAVITPVSAAGEVCFYSQADTHLIADVNGWFATGPGFTPLDPIRLFDTRPDQSQGTVAVTQQKYGGATILKVKIAGTSGVPASGVGAVSLNVTAVDPAGPGYVTVFPCGTRPTASSLNYVIGQTVPNAVIAPLSPDGEVCFYSQADTHLIADVNGWFAAGPGFTPLDPIRLFDTRPDQSQGTVAVTQQKYGGATILKVKIAGTSNVPATDVGAVSLNVTAVDPAGPGYVSVFPCGTRPTVSSLNYVTGQTVPNAVIAPLSPDGEVCFYSQADTHLIADVNGWFAT